jgi:hypothetical protein
VPFVEKAPKQDAEGSPTLEPSILSPLPEFTPDHPAPFLPPLGSYWCMKGCGGVGFRNGGREEAPLVTSGFRAASQPLALSPAPSKVSTDKAGGFGHCGNRSAEKWVGVIPQHKGCTHGSAIT